MLLRPLLNIPFYERAWWGLSDGYKDTALLNLDFLLKLAQICKKCTVMGNLKTTTHVGKKETRQMTTFFSSTIWALIVCEIYFCI